MNLRPKEEAIQGTGPLPGIDIYYDDFDNLDLDLGKEAAKVRSMPVDLDSLKLNLGTNPAAVQGRDPLPATPNTIVPIEHPPNGVGARSNLGPYTMNHEIEQPQNEQPRPIKGIIKEYKFAMN